MEGFWALIQEDIMQVFNNNIDIIKSILETIQKDSTCMQNKVISDNFDNLDLITYLSNLNIQCSELRMYLDE